MAKFFRQDARMTTAVAPFPSVSSRVQLSARQRACVGQIVRRQTSPQRLVRRAKLLLALETGANQCHGMRQMHRNRGTVQGWGRWWCALAPKLAQMEAEEGSDQALTPVSVEALTDAPRSGTPATLTPDQIVQIVAVACEDPRDSGRPVSHWTPRAVAEEVRKRRMVETISTRRVGRFLQSGGFAASSGRVQAQRQAGCPRRLYRPRGGRVCRVSAGASRGSGRRPCHQYG
jgi:putative transposase